MQNKIDIIISTFGIRIRNVGPIIKKENPAIHYIIIHQIENENQIWSDHRIIERDDVTYFSIKEKGLTRSRNKGIKLSQNQYILFFDDDIQFRLEGIFEILNHLKSDSSIDILTFQTTLPEGGLRKKYKEDAFRHNRKSITNVSSIEICGRTSSVKNLDLSFDEKFGLGAEYPISEEFIFLYDCIRNNCNVKYAPIPVTIHPLESSGRIYSKEMIRAKGALFARLFKTPGIFGIMYYGIKHYSEYKNEYSLLSFIKISFQGFYRFRSTDKPL